MNYTHAKHFYAECVRLTADNVDQVFSLLTRYGARCTPVKNGLLIRWGDNRPRDSLFFLPLGGWVRKGENGIVKCYVNDEEFRARGYKDISEKA